MSLNDNLVAYWKLDEASGTRVDATGRGNDLTDNNTVTSDTGIISNAAVFVSANTESLTRSDNADLSMNGTSFTISTWVYASSDDFQIIGKDDHSTGNREYSLLRAGGLARFYILNGGAAFVTGPSFSASAWHHIICWNDTGANTINIQVDGGSVTSAADGGVVVPNSNAIFALGGRNFSGTPDLLMDGRLDETGLWKRVLIADERSALYNSGSGLAYPFPAPSSPSFRINKLRPAIFKPGLAR